MKLIKPSFEIIEPTGYTMDDIYKSIELAGRTCYKSEDKITETSAKEFVDRMIKSGHGAMLEFGTIYLKVPANIDEVGNVLDEVWTKCKLVEEKDGNWWAITTNYRVLVKCFAKKYTEYILENYLCEPTEYHEKRVCARFNCSIAISRELNRHRVNSIAEQSTRYCNFTKDKFGNSITFIKPYWIRDNLCNSYSSELDILAQSPLDGYSKVEEVFLNSLISAERSYFELINLGYKPQVARGILPLDTATEVNHCAFVSDWKHFFKLRASHAGAKGMHPDMDLIANKVYDEFKSKKYI